MKQKIMIQPSVTMETMQMMKMTMDECVREGRKTHDHDWSRCDDGDNADDEDDDGWMCEGGETDDHDPEVGDDGG